MKHLLLLLALVGTAFAGAPMDSPRFTGTPTYGTGAQANFRTSLGLGTSDTVTFGTVRAGTFGQDGVSANLDGTLVADGAASNSIVTGAGVYGHGIWDIYSGSGFLLLNSGANTLTVGGATTWTWLGSSKVAFFNSIGLGAINGIVKFNGAGVPSAAVAGTDYAPATSGTAILKGNGSGGTTAATAGTDYPGLGTANTFAADQTVSSTTEATTGGAGAVKTSGGIYAAKAIVTNSATASSSTTTGALIAAGGAGIGGDVNIGGKVTMAGIDQQAANELRDGRDYVYSDGATSGRAAIWTPGATETLPVRRRRRGAAPSRCRRARGERAERLA